MEEADISRLKEEQEKAIVSTEQQISTWEKFKSDYTTLQERLRTLPDKVSHPVMVPFGKKAFMPGRLVHTNEVLVLLGDNWFAERSAKQACEIIDRRLVGINKQIEDLHKQRDLLKPRVDFTSDLQDIAQARGEMFEIQEEYDETKEKKWREQHRKNVQKQRKSDREERQKITGEKKPEVREKTLLSDTELWARLDELERIETQRKELSRLPAADTRSPNIERTVRWADERDDNTEQTDSSEEEGAERPKYIHFTHTKKEVNPATEGGDNSIDPVPTDSSQITSPADIYKLFHPPHPKSILKSNTRTEGENIGEKSVTEEKTFLTHSATAFSGSIVERDTSVPVTMTTGTEQPNSKNESVTSRPKRVSKFKADRQKQQSSSR